MEITLFINTGENNRVDKTAYLEEVITLEGTLRDQSSIINPVFMIEMPTLPQSPLIDEDDEEIDEVVIDSDYFYRFNYAYIKEFDRYYFMQDLVIVRGHLFQLTLICDVLMSFRDGLLSLPAFIDRNEYDFDAKEVDEVMPLKLKKKSADTIIDATNTVAGSKINIGYKLNQLDGFGEWDRYNIVLTLVGDNGYKEGEYSSGFGVQEIDTEHFTSGAITSYLISRGLLSNVIADMNGALSEWASNLVSCYAFPFRLDNLQFYDPATDLVQLQFGWDENGDAQLYDASPDSKKGYRFPTTSAYMICSDFMMPDTESYLDCPPYAQYEIYIPYFGWHSLDYDAVVSLQGHRILIYHAINFIDGSATAYIYDRTENKIIFSTPCKMGIELPVSRNDAEQVRAQKDAVGANLMLGMISSMVSVGVGVATENPVAIVGGALAGAKSVASAINANALLYTKTSASFGDSFTTLYTDQRPRLRKTTNEELVDDILDYAKLMGRPLRQVRYLYELNGFTIVGEIHLENLNAFKREKEEIEHLLKLGVIL